MLLKAVGGAAEHVICPSHQNEEMSTVVFMRPHLWLQCLVPESGATVMHSCDGATLDLIFTLLMFLCHAYALVRSAHSHVRLEGLAALFVMQAYDECNGPAVMLEFLAGCSDSKLLEAGLHHMHRACSASALLCGIWGAQGSMELALAVAADTTWPYRVRRSALLLVSVLCRGSPESARHFLLLEVGAGRYQADRSVCVSVLCVCLPSVCWSVCL